jgi:hypothetical protein
VAREKCKSCPKYVSFIRLDGDVPETHNAQYCIGDSACYSEVSKQSKKNSGKKETGQPDPDGPRVEWHGEYFRQQFYFQEVPQLLDGLLTEDPRRLQLALAVLVHGVGGLHGWFCEKLKVTPPEPRYAGTDPHLELRQILEFVRPLRPIAVEVLAAQACVRAAFLKEPSQYYHLSSTLSFGNQERAAIAEFLDIDFSKFQVSDEWLQKKTKSELVRFIAHESGLPDDERFQNYLEPYKLTLEKLAGLKKPLLIQIINDCGVDLHGRLPREIAERPKAATPALPMEGLPHCGLCGCCAVNPCDDNCDGVIDNETLMEQLKSEFGVDEQYVCYACADRMGEEE